MSFQSNKKKKLLQHNDKLYRFERTNHNNLDVSYYSCYNCGSGRLICTNNDGDGNNIVESKRCSETCDSSHESQMALAAKQALVTMCANRIDLTPQTCYEIARRDLEIQCPAALQHFPSFLSMRTNLNRAKKETLPALPTSYETIPAADIFPAEFQLNFKNDGQFLFLDLVYVPEVPTLGLKRILAFMSVGSAFKLCQADKIFLDGTFKVCPPPFYQLFTICTLRGLENEARLIPRLYALLPSKSGHCYSFFSISCFWLWKIDCT